MSLLKEKYQKEIIPALKKELKMKSVMTVPNLEKIKLNIGIGKWLSGSKDFSEVEDHLTLISGQKPIITKAKKSISNFKLREGMVVGMSVTLRGKGAWDFLEKFINIATPRIRDFRGFKIKSFDGGGNYSVGIKDIQIFPEINPEKIVKPVGVEISIVTTSKDDAGAKLFLEKINFPFKKIKKPKN